MSEQLRVTIAMLTFHRPDDLAAVVPMLIEHAAELEQHMGEVCSVDVVVVDNDSAGTGRAIVEAFTGDRVRYLIEPTPGIPAGRNRVLDEVADSDIVVFIDDDERPHPAWLVNLVDTHLRTGAVAVAGPVVSEFVGELDPWVAEADFFRRRRLPTGTPIDVAATNNLLLDLRFVRSLGLRFDPRFGLSGADDTLFTRTLAAKGGRLVWCDEAVVTDVVPASRMTRRWVLRRAFSSGNSWSLTSVALGSSRSSRTGARGVAAGRGLVRLAVGGLRYLAGLMVRSRFHETRGLRTASRGAGMLVGAADFAYQEYGAPGDRRRRLRRVGRP